jgi:hypothetical protein
MGLEVGGRDEIADQVELGRRLDREVGGLN